MNPIETLWCDACDTAHFPAGVTSVHALEIKRFAKSLILECAKVINNNDFGGSTIGTNLLASHFGIDLDT